MFIKNFDFLSPDITLYHLEKDQHSSLFSGIVSLLLILFGGILAVIFSLDLIERKNPTAYYSKTWEKDIGIFPIDDDRFLHFITVFSDRFPYEDEFDSTLMTFFGFMKYNKSIFLNKEVNNYEHWVYSPCDEDYLQKFPEFNDFVDYNFTRLCISYYYDNITKNYTHISDKNFIWPDIRHGIENENTTFYSIIMANCFKNEDINITDCFDGNVKYQGMQNFILNFTYAEPSVELSNYKKPIKNRLKTISFSLTKSFIFNANITMTPIKIYSNNGIVFDSEKIYTGQKYLSKTYSYSYETNLNLYGGISIKLENDEEIYFRNYKKLQDIAGGVDGFTEILVLLFKFINLFIYHDFQVVYDFNKIIEGRITKLNKRITVNQSKYSESLDNENKKTSTKIVNKKNIPTDQIEKKIPSLALNNYITSNLNVSNLKNNNNNVNESLQNLKTQGTVFTKLIKNYRNIKWLDFFIHRNLCGQTLSYIDTIIKKRCRLLSEEKLFKMDVTIKYLCENYESEKSNNTQGFFALKKINSVINKKI